MQNTLFLSYDGKPDGNYLEIDLNKIEVDKKLISDYLKISDVRMIISFDKSNFYNIEINDLNIDEEIVDFNKTEISFEVPIPNICNYISVINYDYINLNEFINRLTKSPKFVPRKINFWFETFNNESDKFEEIVVYDMNHFFQECFTRIKYGQKNSLLWISSDNLPTIRFDPNTGYDEEGYDDGNSINMFFSNNFKELNYFEPFSNDFKVIDESIKNIFSNNIRNDSEYVRQYIEYLSVTWD